MDFRILGPMEVWDADRLVRVGGPGHRRLLAALILARNHVVSQEQLVDILWSSEPPVSAAAIIHVRVSDLRSSLGKSPDGTSPILTTAGGYQLAIAPADVDSFRFQAQAESGHRALASSHYEGAVDTLRGAVGLWRGDAYGDLKDQPAAQAEIARLETIRTGAEDDLLEARLNLGEHGAVAAELAALVVQTPWAERRWSLLMLAQYRCGQQGEALTTFGIARDRLVNDLGVEPGPDLRQMHEAVLNQDPQLQLVGSAPAQVQHDAPPVRPSLPSRLTSFVGRGSDIARVRQLLLEFPLVTLTGPGGAGKTSLALEVAALVGATYPGGVWLVELAPTADLEQVLIAIATRLGIKQQQGTSLVTQISNRLGGTSSILILDNCEHVLDTVTSVIAQLLPHTPELTVLTTSRERLGLSGEHVHQLTGLGLPVDGRDHLPSEVGRSEAAQLLIDRATAVRSDFRLDHQTAPQIAGICRRLDGLPLAIELAAAAVSALDIEQIAVRLDDCLELLSQGRRPDARHGSLRSVVDWSYELLSTDERQLFEQVAVFQGTFTLPSAEDVCRLGTSSTSVAALLWRLVDKSLIYSETSGDGRRYRLIETLKEYALQRLSDRGDLTRFRQRHAEHFLGLAEHAGAALRGPNRRYWVAGLEREHSNLRAAMEWFIQNGQGESVTRLASSIYAFWDLSGHYGEGRRWLTRALASPEGIAPAARIRALMGSATLAVMQGDLSAADALSAEVIDLSRAHADYEGLSHALQFRGLAAIFASDLETADQLIGESLQAARIAGQPWLEGWALEFQAAVQLARASYDAAIRLAAQSAELSRRDGDPECAAWALVTMAIAHIENGHVDLAIAPLRDSLTAFRQLGVSWGLSLAIFACAEIAALQTNFSSAAFLLGASEQLRLSSRAGMLPSLQRSFHHWRETCSQALGPETFTMKWSAGEAETVEQMLSRAEELLTPLPFVVPDPE
jgi:predicted ATPase/DNA-binding SARP family transcriptional activator